MENQNYWEAVQPTTDILPSVYLKQRADEFNKAMGTKLVMRTKTLQRSENSWESLVDGSADGEKTLVIKLFIEAPLLKGYTLAILEASYKPSAIYPCTIENILESKERKTVSTSGECKSLIDEIVFSEVLKQIVSNLLAQVQG